MLELVKFTQFIGEKVVPQGPRGLQGPPSNPRSNKMVPWSMKVCKNAQKAIIFFLKSKVVYEKPASL